MHPLYIIYPKPPGNLFVAWVKKGGREHQKISQVFVWHQRWDVNNLIMEVLLKPTMIQRIYGDSSSGLGKTQLNWRWFFGTRKRNLTNHWYQYSNTRSPTRDNGWNPSWFKYINIYTIHIYIYIQTVCNYIISMYIIHISHSKYKRSIISSSRLPTSKCWP